MKNKGFSLIELLVAVAIAGIIVLMLSFMLVQSTNLFGDENDKIGIRNDYQLVRSQIEQAIMEAKSLSVVRCGEDIMIYTGEVNDANNHLKAEDNSNVTTERVITFDKSEGKLYISSSYDKAVSEGNLICSTVTDFDIVFSKKCFRPAPEASTEEEYYVNPLSVDIILEMSGKKSNLDSILSVRLRNVLKDVSIYTTDNREMLLVNATKVEPFKVK